MSKSNVIIVDFRARARRPISSPLPPPRSAARGGAEHPELGDLSRAEMAELNAELVVIDEFCAELDVLDAALAKTHAKALELDAALKGFGNDSA